MAKFKTDIVKRTNCEGNKPFVVVAKIRDLFSLNWDKIKNV